MPKLSGRQTIEKHITLELILKLSGSLSGSGGSRIHTPLKLNATFRLSDLLDSYRKGIKIEPEGAWSWPLTPYVVTTKRQACNIIY